MGGVCKGGGTLWNIAGVFLACYMCKRCVSICRELLKGYAATTTSKSGEETKQRQPRQESMKEKVCVSMMTMCAYRVSMMTMCAYRVSMMTMCAYRVSMMTMCAYRVGTHECVCILGVHEYVCILGVHEYVCI